MKQSSCYTLALGLTAAVLGSALGTGPSLAQQTSAATAGGEEAEQIEKGRKLFIAYGCGWCHEGGGRKAARCPQLMDDPHDHEFFINRIVGGSSGRMPAYGISLIDTDIRALLAYLRGLKPEP